MTSDWIYICTLCEKMSESVSPNKIPLITIIKLVSVSDPSSKKILLKFKKRFLAGHSAIAAWLLTSECVVAIWRH